jgi:hypothetical protein
MNNSRAGLVAMLVAVQVLIVGFAIYSLRGPGNMANMGNVAFAHSGLHAVHYQAKPIAPMAVGLAPVVTIDDVDSHVVVTTSNDRFVHVTDETSENGWIWGDHQTHDVQTSRTLDGVRIYRPSGTGTFGFNMDTQRIEVAVPADSHLVIDRSRGAEVTGLRNDVSVTSQDGRIYLTDVKANNVKAHSDDGRIVAMRVSANVIEFSSNDGRIETSQLEPTGIAPRVTMHTEDGPLVIGGTFIASGTYQMSTNDGRVELNLALGSSATVDAATGDGHIVVDGQKIGDGGGTNHTVRVAAGLSSMNVRTADGSIHISTNGAGV